MAFIGQSPKEESIQRFRDHVSSGKAAFKLLGAISDSVSAGDWRALRRVSGFYRIWTEPIF